MKKFIVFLLCGLVILNLNNIIFADSTKDRLEMSFEEAAKQLETNNIEIKLLDSKIEILNKQYFASLDKAEEAKGRMHPEESGIVKLRKDELINWKKKHLELEILKNERIERINSLNNELQKYYFNALMLKQDIENIGNEIKNFDQNIQQLNIKLKMGQIKEADVKSAQAQRFQIVAQRNTILRQYETTLISIKKMLGINIGDTLNLTEGNRRLELFDDKDLDERIINAIKSDYKLISQTEELELLRQELKIVEDYSNRRMPDEVESLKNIISEKALRLEDINREVEATLWSTYYNIKNAEDTIEIEKINLELAELNLKAAEVNAKLGKLSELGLSNARLEVAKQKNRLQKEINEYMLQIKNYKTQLCE